MDEADFNDLMRIQRLAASRIVQESEVDTKIKILNIISDMDHGRNTPLTKESVIIEAIAQGVTEAEAVDILNQLVDDHLVIEPKEGFVQRT
ncbi:MAG: hypothetical protein ABIE94_04250 [archaeon]